MKKLFFLIVIGIVTFNSLGQDTKLSTKTKSYFGVKAGVNMINSSHYDDGSHQHYGYQIGATYTIPLSSRFSFQPELVFQSIQSGNKTVDVFFNGSNSDENKYKNTYALLPFIFKYEFSKKFNLDFGPNVSFLLSSKQTNRKEMSYNGTVDAYESTTTDTSNMRKIGLGINLGTNYTIVSNLYVGLRYTLMVGSQNVKSTMDNSIFALSAGYNFR